jgi:predicted DNA-binding protein
MPRDNDQNKYLQVLVSRETYSRLEDIAKNEGMKNISDFVRDCIKRRCEELGYNDLDFQVDRGGYRKRN